MGRELTYELLEKQVRRSRVLVAACGLAGLLAVLWALAPAALKCNVSSASAPATPIVVADPQAVPATPTNEFATQNIRVISIDGPAASSSTTIERSDSEPTAESASAAPEVTRPNVEEEAPPSQVAKGWAPLEPVANATVADGEATSGLQPPFPRRRPRVEAIIAAAQVPLPYPRPMIQAEEPTGEPQVITDRMGEID